MESTLKKIKDGFVWTYIGTIISSVYGFVSVPILLVYFGKSEYGLIGLAMSLNVYLQLMDLGISGTTVRFFSSWLTKKEYRKVNTLFSTSLFLLGTIGLLNALILGVFSCYCQNWFSLSNSQTVIMQHLIYILMFNAIISWFISTFDQLIKSNQDVSWLQKRAIFPQIFQIIILFTTVYCGLNLTMYFFLSTFVYLLIMPLTINKVKKILPGVSFYPKFDRAILREIFTYSISVFSFGIFQFSMLNLRPIILGIQADLDSVADFKILNGIISMVLMLSGCFFSVMLPSSSKIVAEGNVDAQQKIIYQGTKYVTILLSCFIFGGIVVGTDLLQLYVGESYTSLSKWLTIWLISLFVQHNQPISTLIFSHTNLKPIAIMSAISTMIGLIFCWLLSPSLGIGGVVIGYLIYTLSQTLFYYLYYWRKYLEINSHKVFVSSFMPPVLAGLFICIIVRILMEYLHTEAFLSFWVEGSLFVLLYVVATYKIVFNKEDREFFKTFFIKH